MTDSSIWSRQGSSIELLPSYLELSKTGKIYNKKQLRPGQSTHLCHRPPKLQIASLFPTPLPLPPSPPPPPPPPPRCSPVLFILITHHNHPALLAHHLSPTLFTNPAPSYLPIPPPPTPPSPFQMQWNSVHHPDLSAANPRYWALNAKEEKEEERLLQFLKPWKWNGSNGQPTPCVPQETHKQHTVCGSILN